LRELLLRLLRKGLTPRNDVSSGAPQRAVPPVPPPQDPVEEEPVYANDDGGFDGDDGGFDGDDDATSASSPPAAQQLPDIEARFMAMDGPFSATSYFDPKRAAATRGWAGPSHWKFAVVVAPAAATSSKAKAAPKEKKPKRLLDFARGVAPAATVFALPKSAATTLLSKKDREALEEHLLPIDVHFDAHDLYRLFSRPLTVLGVAGALPQRTRLCISRD